MPRIRDYEDFNDYSSRQHVRRRRQDGGFHREDEREHSRWDAVGNSEAGHRATPSIPKEIEFGDVLQVPDNTWGFANAKSLDHPGVCVDEEPGEEIAFFKGTDASRLNQLYRAQYLIFDGSPNSGLKKPTAFGLQRFPLRFRHVRLFYPQRHIGQFDTAEQAGLRAALATTGGGEDGEAP